MNVKEKRYILVIFLIVFTFVLVIIPIALKNEKTMFIVRLNPSINELDEGIVLTSFEPFFRVYDGYDDHDRRLVVSNNTSGVVLEGPNILLKTGTYQMIVDCEVFNSEILD